MPWIKNTDLASVYNGYELSRLQPYNAPDSIILIQIFDPTLERSQPDFAGLLHKVYQYSFLDIERGQYPDIDYDDVGMSNLDAASINKVLKSALELNKNVLVHCTAGVSRSGAVVEHAVSLGFKDPEIYRHPNETMMKQFEELNNGAL